MGFQRLEFGAFISVRLWSWALLLVGCAGASESSKPSVTAPAPAPASAPSPSHEFEGAEEPRRCTFIAHGCPTYQDVDGCPDYAVQLGPECSPSTEARRGLDEMAGELLDDPQLTRLDLYGEPRCTDWVKSELVRRGVSAERLATKVPYTPEPNMVANEVGAYAGKECD